MVHDDPIDRHTIQAISTISLRHDENQQIDMFIYAMVRDHPIDKHPGDCKDVLDR